MNERVRTFTVRGRSRARRRAFGTDMCMRCKMRLRRSEQARAPEQRPTGGRPSVNSAMAGPRGGLRHRGGRNRSRGCGRLGCSRSRRREVGCDRRRGWYGGCLGLGERRRGRRRRRRDFRRQLCGGGRSRRRDRRGRLSRQERQRIDVALVVRGLAEPEVDERVGALDGPRGADAPDDRALADLRAARYGDRAEVDERRRVPERGLDRNGLAAPRDRSGEGDDPARRRTHVGAARGAEVDTAMLPGGVRVRTVE
jgi:hypothetical protein